MTRSCRDKKWTVRRALNRRAFQRTLVALKSRAIQRAVAQESPAIKRAAVAQKSFVMLLLFRNPLYSNFLFFWDAVKFPCDIIHSDKE